MLKATLQALIAARMCRSFRGADFTPRHGRSSVGAFAKAVTARAERRLSAALSKEGLNDLDGSREDELSLLMSEDDGLPAYTADRLWWEQGNAC
jgi:hypothetical protein